MYDELFNAVALVGLAGFCTLVLLETVEPMESAAPVMTVAAASPATARPTPLPIHRPPRGVVNRPLSPDGHVVARASDAGPRLPTRWRCRPSAPIRTAPADQLRGGPNCRGGLAARR